MTCIVAVKDGNGDIVMGADSRVSNEDFVRTAAFPKIVRKGEFLIGAAGSLPLVVHALFTFAPPKRKGEDLLAYMASDFVAALIRNLKGLEFLSSDKEGESLSLFLLVATEGRIFEVAGDGCVNEVAEGYTAAGAGEELAIGAFAGLDAAGVVSSAEERALIALTAASKFSSSVGPPFTFLHSSEKKKRRARG